MEFEMCTETWIALGTMIATTFTAYQVLIVRKQLYATTIAKCINDYRELQPISIKTYDLSKIEKYVDLCNEELFYIKHDYIPKEVAYEWIDGMIYMIPIKINNTDVIINGEKSNTFILEGKLIENYPRITNSFKVRKCSFRKVFEDVDSKENLDLKKELILHIYENIKENDFMD